MSHFDYFNCHQHVLDFLSIPISCSQDNNWKVNFAQPFDSLLSVCRQIVGNGGEYEGCPIWWRGQEKYDWSLKPSIWRKYGYEGCCKGEFGFSDEVERDMLSRFRDYAYGLFNRQPNWWEAIFLAKHHGLPVRLIDWTSNPLAALYFACEKEQCTDGALWALVRVDAETYRNNTPTKFFKNKKCPLDVEGVKFIYPFMRDYPRITAQAGAFTIHNWRGVTRVEELERLAGVKFLGNELDIRAIIKWKIPRKLKGEIIDSLERMDVNHRTLFPDLDGIAKGVWRSEIIRS